MDECSTSAEGLLQNDAGEEKENNEENIISWPYFKHLIR